MEGTSSNVSIGQSDGRKRGPTSEEEGAHKRKKAKTLTKQERNQTLLQESIQELERKTAFMKTSFEKYQLKDEDITYAIDVLLPDLCIDVLTKEPDIETLEMLQDPIPPIDENDTFKRLKPCE
jgi:predicted RNase H-like nuclease (RuvC/YqgF family)